MANNMRSRIAFISYSAPDHAHAEALAIQLGTLGYDIQFEHKLLTGQIEWHQVIESIRRCDVFIFVLTSYTTHSYPRMLEYNYALSLGKPVLPVLIKGSREAVLPAVGTIFDYRKVKSGTETELRARLNSLPEPAPNPTAQMLDWLSPLSELRERIVNLSNRREDQEIILLNLREFLERSESFPRAYELLELLKLQPGTSESVHEGIKQTFHQVAMTYNQKNRIYQRNRLIAILIFFAFVIILLIILNRDVILSRITFDLLTLGLNDDAVPTASPS